MLGLACVGKAPEGLPATLPVQRIAAPLLSGEASYGEAWQSALFCLSGDGDGIRYRADANVLFGVLELDEAAFRSCAGGAVPALQQATKEAYRRIFRLLDAEGYPELWRVWNYLADINVDADQPDGLERYRQFNIGRQEAFLASGRLTSGKVPAACALGVRSGPLSIAFMAGREPAKPLENPRQISAWDYPDHYGPRAPTFSRGALASFPGQELLFISGTASILGHQTVHVGDVAAQVHEAMANIAAVLGEANRVAKTDTEQRPYALADLSYRVYVRHAEDFATVRSSLLQSVGAAAEVVYVQADICRADLLVEIEATATRALLASSDSSC
ncbi:MAG: hypothetical protein H6943_02755 [Zoogloeaceae bacterium]|nr:hypothetical protein [Zoogloeaceae bacterium]